MKIASISDIEFIKSVWREKREPVSSVLTDDFVARFSKFATWNCLSQYYGFTAPIDMLRSYHHRFKWSTLLNVRKFPENILRELYAIFDEQCGQL